MSSLEEIKNHRISMLEHLNIVMVKEIQSRNDLIDRFVNEEMNDDYRMSEREKRKVNPDFDRFHGMPLEDEREYLLTEISDSTSWIRKQRELIAFQEAVVESPLGGA